MHSQRRGRRRGLQGPSVAHRKRWREGICSEGGTLSAEDGQGARWRPQSGGEDDAANAPVRARSRSTPTLSTRRKPSTPHATRAARRTPARCTPHATPAGSLCEAVRQHLPRVAAPRRQPRPLWYACCLDLLNSLSGYCAKARKRNCARPSSSSCTATSSFARCECLLYGRLSPTQAHQDQLHHPCFFAHACKSRMNEWHASLYEQMIPVCHATLSILQ